MPNAIEPHRSAGGEAAKVRLSVSIRVHSCSFVAAFLLTLIEKFVVGSSSLVGVLLDDKYQIEESQSSQNCG
jgi:hypothetical protein